MWCTGNSNSQQELPKVNDYQQERLWMQGMKKQNKTKT